MFGMSGVHSGQQAKDEEDTGVNHHICTCVPGWTDANCDMNVNECDEVYGVFDVALKEGEMVSARARGAHLPSCTGGRRPPLACP